MPAVEAGACTVCGRDSCVDPEHLATEKRARGRRRAALAAVEAIELGQPPREEWRCHVCGSTVCTDPEHHERDDRERKRELDAAARPALPFTRASDFAHAAPEVTEWLVPPYLPRGALLLLDGKPKVSGKTSLLLALSRAVVTGGPFLGETSTRGPVVYLSEQGRTLLRPYLDAAGLLTERDFVFLTWGDTFGRPWEEIASETAQECKRLGAALLVVDTVGRWLGLRDDKGNSEGAVREALGPLKAAAETGLSVVLARHEGKADRALGEAGLGSTAFQGEVDGMASLRRPEEDRSDAARVLHFLGRWEAPERQVVERDHRDHGIYRACSGVASLDVRVLQQVRCAPGASKRAVCKGVSGRGQDVLATIDRLLRMDPPMLVDRGDDKSSALFVATMEAEP